MTEVPVSRDALRGLLSWAVLASLERSPMHGYALMGHLRASGFQQLKSGTLYPLLHRLELAGYVSFSWDHDGAGPARKVLHLAEEGRRAASEAESTTAATRTYCMKATSRGSAP